MIVTKRSKQKHYQSKRTGLSYYQLRELKGKILWNQSFICPGCDRPTSEWQRLTGELHHIDGNPRNNQIWNLQVLCGICHYDIHNWRTFKERKETPYLNS